MLAYALSELAVNSGDASLVVTIDPKYPAAISLAYLKLGEYQKAWEAADKIQDPFEKARAQSAIVNRWAEMNPSQASLAAEQIQIDILRERAMRDVIRITGDASLVQKMSIAYHRVLALTSLGKFEEAWEQAELLKETYPLVELGLALVGN